MATPRQRQLIFALFFTSFALVVTVLSLSDAVPAISRSFSNLVLALGRQAEQLLPIDLARDDIPWRGDQIGHAGIWGAGMLGMGLGLRKSIGLLTTALVMIAVGFGFELAQGLFTATRSVSMQDGLGNTAGIAIATIIVAIIGPLVDRFIAHKSESHQLVA